MEKSKDKRRQFLILSALTSALLTTLIAIVAVGAVKTQFIASQPNVKALSADLESVTIQPNSQELTVKELRARPRVERSSDSLLSYLSLYLPRYAELDEDRSVYWERSYSWQPSDFWLTPAGLLRTSDGQYILLHNFRQTIQEELDRWGDDQEQGVLIETSYVDQQGRLAWLYKPVCDMLFDISCYIHSLKGTIAFFSITPGLLMMVGLTLGYSAGVKKRQKENLM